MTKLSYSELKFVSYGGNQLPSFFKYDKQDEDLVIFYNEDAEKCETESVSKIIDVYHEEKFVAYYAFATSEIKSG